MENNKTYAILGAGGSIGNSLAAELIKRGVNVKLISRSNYKMEGAKSVRADITNYNQLNDAVKDSDTLFLCAGLKYDWKIWRETWPQIIKNSINVCKNNNAKLIFFDNVYMYGKVNGKMIEETPYNPCSKKGEIRAEIALLLEDEYKKGNITASIARAADLYGVYGGKNCAPNFMVIENLMNGKKANGLANLNKKHSLTYIPDCAKGLILLAEDEKTYNQIWHMPTTNPALTSLEFIKLTAKELNLEADQKVLKSWMVKLAGLFNKTISEVYEMMYQYENEYNFDSTKFNKYFNFSPTPYINGIRETINWLKTNKKTDNN
ncbi:MAG: NAD-dependent epimerase/dehydratase family protein [bacterium]